MAKTLVIFYPGEQAEDPTIRTEQLRKLGKLKHYYLDEFNQNGVLYATCEGCKTALQLGTMERVLSFWA
jgi:hypothetical protein